MTLNNKIFSSRLLKTLLVLVSTTLLITCDQLIPTPSTSDDPAPTYKVTYNGNNADSGSAPSDTNSYANGATVTVLDNSGNLARNGYSFIGWNTEADRDVLPRPPVRPEPRLDTSVEMFCADKV